MRKEFKALEGLFKELDLYVEEFEGRLYLQPVKDSSEIAVIEWIENDSCYGLAIDISFNDKMAMMHILNEINKIGKVTLLDPFMYDSDSGKLLVGEEAESKFYALEETAAELLFNELLGGSGDGFQPDTGSEYLDKQYEEKDKNSKIVH
ncbi:MAG TPA: hypothetical protein PKI14_01505 [Fervidobacterium sp.]|nr:hypothetical protein [Fervidobacterium sp.]